MAEVLKIGIWVDGDIVYEVCPVTHHPHIQVICDDEICGCELEYITCHVCKEDWPCATKRKHLSARGKPFIKEHGIWHRQQGEKICSTCYSNWPCDKRSSKEKRRGKG
jgi:hypothetical protein